MIVCEGAVLFTLLYNCIYNVLLEIHRLVKLQCNYLTCTVFKFKAEIDFKFFT